MFDRLKAFLRAESFEALDALEKVDTIDAEEAFMLEIVLPYGYC